MLSSPQEARGAPSSQSSNGPQPGSGSSARIACRRSGRVQDKKLRKSDLATQLTEVRVRNKADKLAERRCRPRIARSVTRRERARGFDIVVIGGHRWSPGLPRPLPRELRAPVAGTLSVARAPPRWPRCAAAPQPSRRATSTSGTSSWPTISGQGSHGRPGHGGAGRLPVGRIGRGGPDLAGPAGRERSGRGVRRIRLAGPFRGAPGVRNCTRRTPDVVDELVQAVITESGAAHHIAPDGGLGGYVTGANCASRCRGGQLTFPARTAQTLPRRAGSGLPGRGGRRAGTPPPRESRPSWPARCPARPPQHRCGS